MILGNGGSFPFTEEGMKALLKAGIEGVTIVAIDVKKKTDSQGTSSTSSLLSSFSVFGFALIRDQVFQIEASSGKIMYPPPSFLSKKRRGGGGAVKVPVIVDPMRFFKNVPMFPCWMMIHEGRAVGMMNAVLRGEDERASINTRLEETPMMFVARMVVSSGSSSPEEKPGINRGELSSPPSKPFIFITD